MFETQCHMLRGKIQSVCLDYYYYGKILFPISRSMLYSRSLSFIPETKCHIVSGVCLYNIIILLSVLFRNYLMIIIIVHNFDGYQKDTAQTDVSVFPLCPRIQKKIQNAY